MKAVADIGLTGVVEDGFRVKEATDMATARDAIALARVRGSVGASDCDFAAGSDYPVRFATVARIGTYFDDGPR